MKYIQVFLCSIIIIMFLLTILTFYPNFGIHYFGGGSIESTMDLLAPKAIASLSALCVVIIVFVIFRKKIKILMPLFFLTFIVWLGMGRTIGVYWYGEIQTGWYFIPFNKFEIPINENNNKSTSFNFSYNKTFITISGNNYRKTFFVGNILANDLKTLLIEKYKVYYK